MLTAMVVASLFFRNSLVSSKIIPLHEHHLLIRCTALYYQTEEVNAVCEHRTIKVCTTNSAVLVFNHLQDSLSTKYAIYYGCTIA